ncbi:EI24 domain-containing protein [Sphingobium algorifonticola]|uniref:Cysteine biosynthesis protein n=1 Tax=Sphingobium algorifonticola TaxID=2008318 RepID=A0A437JCJ2_9SPHN|nr:EI24 domain-containing protein [Sphingobium algorifonticola]RVT43648.1 cysteine biosynthesis protein [Sphingobium algorifonticola]
MIVTAALRAFPQIFHPVARAVLIRSLMVTVLLFALLGVGLRAGLHSFFGWIGWAERAGGLVEAAAAVLLAAASAWLLFRSIAIVVIGLFGDAIVAAIERESYPQQAERAHDVSFAQGMRLALRSVLRTVGWNLVALPFYIALLVTGVGTLALLLAVNAYLLGRDLADMVEARHPERPPIPKGTRLAMGFVSALLFLVPVANLLAPVWSAAMAVHVLHGAGRKRDD